MNPVIKTRKLSKWYGNILGLSDVTLKIEKGITGLLGPNGAGKSTFLKLLTGQIKANIGSVMINGEKVRNNHRIFSQIGFCPESDSFYEEMTGWEFVTGLLKLHHFSQADIEKRAAKALNIVDLEKAKDRRIKTYSRGMRQRIKFAQAIAHEPDVLILDEPLNGLDPLGRRKLIRLIKSYRDEGKTIIVSSHVLSEIEAMTNNIILIHQGKIFAQGDIHYIRDLIDTHPHMISVTCSDPRKIASRFVKEDYILNIDFTEKKDNFVVKTNNRDQFFNRLPSVFIEEKTEVQEITSPDDNLQAVFDYLIGE
ncbi:MAG: ATP-binding cassette domain-containing protein [Candidatus Aminicenantes bacterium]|nr:ATP-binding cassette domain-containing protein [Candidatus Aminicenantes bacterium]